jgi:hypothetical protein
MLMGTKNIPGTFDCYANAEPDEPMFVLLGRDPLAPFLMSMWSKVRMGDLEAAGAVFTKMASEIAPRYHIAPDVDKANEALDCSFAMFAWRKEHRS